MLIEQVRNDRTFMRDSKRLERLEELRRGLRFGSYGSSRGH
jgi:hypothetical protein